MKLKDPETILKMLLKEKFKEDLRQGRICAKEKAWEALQDEDMFNGKFEAWLVQNGYAETPMSEEESYRYHTMAARSTLYPGKTIDEVDEIIEENLKRRREYDKRDDKTHGGYNG